MARNQERSSDYESVPRQLREHVNSVFLASIGKVLSVNDNFGSPTMREAVLDEVNNLRRYTLGVLENLFGDKG